MPEYRFERLSEDNLKDLIILYADAFGAQTDIDFLQKKYNTSYTGHTFTGFIAYDENNFPAAYYGVFPALFSLNGEKILCAQSGDTMTHSLHRKKGLFVKLAEHTFELCKSLHMRFIFGFPNSNSLPGFMKLGWLQHHHLCAFRVSVRTLPLSALAKKYKKQLSGMYNWWLKLRLKPYISQAVEIPNSAEQQDTMFQIHDLDFFGYKKYFPKYIINTGGANWYIRLDGRMFIGDFALAPGADFMHEFESLKKIAKKCGANQIEFQCSPNHKFAAEFRLVGALQLDGINACYLPLSSDQTLNFSLVYADADTF